MLSFCRSAIACVRSLKAARYFANVLAILVWSSTQGAFAQPYTLVTFDGQQLRTVAYFEYGGYGTPKEFIEYDNSVYFSAYSSSAQQPSLWRVKDGSLTEFRDVQPCSLRARAVFQNQLYLCGTTETVVEGLFRFDGTRFDLAAQIPSPSSANPTDLIVFRDELYMRASSRINQQELWKYDGKSAQLVQAIANLGTRIPPHPHVASPFFPARDVLYISVNDGVSGQELWQFDGTTATLVDDVNAGPQGSEPSFRLFANDAYYFDATDGLHGREPRRLDSAGISLLVDAAPGPTSSNLRAFFSLQSNVYFRGDYQGKTGLWRLMDDELVHLPGTEGTYTGHAVITHGLAYVHKNGAFFAFDGTRIWNPLPNLPDASNWYGTDDLLFIVLSVPEPPTIDLAIAIFAILVFGRRLLRKNRLGRHCPS